MDNIVHVALKSEDPEPLYALPLMYSSSVVATGICVEIRGEGLEMGARDPHFL